MSNKRSNVTRNPAIKEFKVITGLTDDNEIINYLEICDYNVNDAVNLFLSKDDEKIKPIADYSSSTNISHSKAIMDLYDENGQRIIPDEIIKDKLLGGSTQFDTLLNSYGKFIIL